MTVKLNVLGSLSISWNGNGGAEELLARPKLTALLGYLALAKTDPERWHRRDELAAMFWPESDQAHARRALSQAVYQIRQHLGAEAIDTRGKEELRLTPGRIWCDAAAVRRSLAKGDLRAAVDQYAGELLPAFHLPGDGAFSEWLDAERASLRRDVADASLAVAQGSQKLGDTDDARVHYVTAVRLDPLDRDRVAAAMAGLSEVGQSVTALRLFEDYRKQLRAELDLEPDPELAKLAELVSQSRSVPEPRPYSAPTSAAGVATATASTSVESRRPRWVYLTSALFASVSLLLVLAPLSSRQPQLDDGLVAVLPFAFDGPTERDRWLASAMPVGLSTLLGGTAGLKAVPEQRMLLALEAGGKSWDNELSADEGRTVARAVGAGNYLTATVVSDGKQQRIIATLTDTESGEELHRVQVVIDTLDLPHTIDRLASELLIALAGQQRSATELLSHSPAALREYANGWVARRERRHLDALRHFDAAMDLDSTFALAALAYREVAMWLPDGTPHRRAWERADTIVRRHGHRMSSADRAISEAIFQTYGLENDGFAALAGLRRATLMAPDRPSAWLLLGDYLLHDGPMHDMANHLELATSAFDSALALGDLTPEAERHLVEIRLAERDTAFARQYLADHPRDPSGFSHLWWVAASLAGDSAGLAEFGRGLADEPSSTWRWLVMWSMRAATGFDQADSAAQLLAGVAEMDPSVQRGNRYYLLHYHLNRGRPHLALHISSGGSEVPITRFNGRLRYPAPVMQLEWALAAPEGWVARGQIAETVRREYDQYHPDSRLPAACGLGLHHALEGDQESAKPWTEAMVEWQNDQRRRWRTLSRNCRRVIRALLDTARGPTTLTQVDSILLAKPYGVLRQDISRWNLAVSEGYHRLGMTERAMQLTTRLGYIVESSAWLTPALVREGSLALELGDSLRAAQALDRAARLLSDPEPELEQVAQEVRLTADRLRAWASRTN